MRILQVMASSGVGGVETAFVDTVLALHNAGVQQEVVMRDKSPMINLLREKNIQVLELPFRKRFDFKTKKILKRKIDTYKPQVVQTWMCRASAVCPKGDFIHVGWLGSYRKNKYFKNCDYMIGITPGICQHIMEFGVPQPNVKLLRTFAPNSDEKAISREVMKTPQDVPVLLSLARLHPVKGLDVLLKALVLIPKAHLWLAGEGFLQRGLEVLARELGLEDRIHFLGWRNDRASLLKAADICVFPSRADSFGTVMVEAWAYKIPLVAAACPGPLAHIVDGENGLLVPINDVEALAGAVKKIIEDKKLAKDIIEGGYKDYAAHFTEQAVVKSYTNFYKSIV